MTIRTRLTLWYAGMLLGSLLFMGGLLYYELVGEYARGRAPESPAEKISDIVLFYGLPTMIVLVLGGSWLIHRALRPVEALAASAELVHAGNLTERIPVSGRGDELDRLAGVFNVMLARVEAGVGSVRDFTLHASHELKTPLTILSAETELALNDPATSERERPRLVSQLEEIRRLAALVDGLSLLAKADSGLPMIAREPLRLDELLSAAVEGAGTLAKPQGIRIELTHCEVAPLNGDRAGLRQALLNVLGNAVKHNHPDGWVRIALRASAQQFTLTIENTGTSIPSELLPRIFDRFVRGSATTEGSGLGLCIAKVILEAHGGSIQCTCLPDGVVRFVMRIPRLPGSAQQLISAF